MVMPARNWVGPEGVSRPATPRVCDFTNQANFFYKRDEDGLMRVVNFQGYRLDMGGNSIKRRMDGITRTGGPTEVQMGTKQQRSRARRKLKKGAAMADAAFNTLYKPLDEWDIEELARGRPRNATGDFRGRPPEYITREVHERALERFKVLIRSDMNALTPAAIKVMLMVLENDDIDAKGKPVVPASTKMDAAKFLVEHVVGKPTQPSQTDISVKLQGILGAVMINPVEAAGQYMPAHVGTRGELTAAVYDAEEVDEDDDLEEGE